MVHKMPLYAAAIIELQFDSDETAAQYSAIVEFITKEEWRAQFKSLQADQTMQV
jgi:hypothetical protein